MKKLALILLSLITISGFSQDYPPNGLTGISLHNWLKKNWYDGKFQALGYDGARHAMYDDIDNKNGTLVCVYGGYTRSFTPGGSFTDSYPMTTEHTVPQSFFNYLEPMKSDIHHLFPAHNDLNVGRSNYPFMEINDNDTEKWWKNTTSITNIPSTNIELYSEEDWQKFEPKEDHKGNVARAVFYFYTMYKSGVRTINDCANINDLYNWHINETVDANEKVRNDKTELHQGNRNPYIDYPELLGYAWGFTSSGTKPFLNFTTDKSAIHPNNANGTAITIELEISPKPTSTESITISADANSTLPTSNYSFSKTDFNLTNSASLQSFTVNLIGNTEGYIEINLNGLSSSVDYGHNKKFLLYVTKNLGNNELKIINPILFQNNDYLELNNNHSFIDFELINYSGSILNSGLITDNKISFNNPPKGLYIVRLSNKNYQFTKKIVIR